MVFSTMTLTAAEASLIKTIKELQYGTILEFELNGGDGPKFDREVTRAQREMIEAIRSNGWTLVYQIKIHQADPNYMEVP
ncbi:MAG: hypothetical protein ACKOC5_09575, partial [Chloroflexota bacterium]